jgi:hypothetical protein
MEKKIGRVKRQPKWEKIFSSYSSHTGLTFRINKEPQKLNTKKIQITQNL